MRSAQTKTAFHILFNALLVAGLAACAPATDGAQEQLPPDETVQENVPVPVTTNDTKDFKVPNLTSDQENEILSKYDYVDPTNMVPDDLLREAIVYYDVNKALLANPAYLSVINFAAYSGTKRFYIIDMHSGAVFATYAAHGKNSDPKHTGFATSFSNVDGSGKSSLGFYLTEETYTGAHGYSLRLDGLSTTNSNARARAIVLHAATYVYDKPVLQGRSLGCPAVTPTERDHVINMIKSGSLIYAGLGSTRSSARGLASVKDSSAYPALWEDPEHLDRKQWTAFAYDAVSQYGSTLVAGTNDVTGFCPKYKSLNNNQKISFWAFFMSAISKYESGFDPTNRYKETTMGKDPITGQPVYSEGLLQLSYQDVKVYPFCDQFDWNADKVLKPTDPKKTIFDPQKNLTCGIRILNQLASKKHLVAFDSGNYWSTLKPTGKYGKVASITALTKKIPFCN